MAALSDLKWGKLGLMDVDRCAAHAIHALVHRRSFAIPGMGNRLTYLASRALPRSLVSRSEEHTSELQSLMRISYAVFCLKKKKNYNTKSDTHYINLTSNKHISVSNIKIYNIMKID